MEDLNLNNIKNKEIGISNMIIEIEIGREIGIGIGIDRDKEIEGKGIEIEIEIERDIKDIQNLNQNHTVSHQVHIHLDLVQIHQVQILDQIQNKRIERINIEKDKEIDMRDEKVKVKVEEEAIQEIITGNIIRNQEINQIVKIQEKIKIIMKKEE